MSDVPVSLTVTEKTKEALGQASPWIRFLAVLGFIGIGILVVAGVAMALWGSSFGEAFGMGFLGPILGLVYVALAVVLFFPTRMMLRMAGRTKKYNASADPADLEGFALNVRGLSKFYGIVAIIGIALWVVAILFALVAMGMRAAG